MSRRYNSHQPSFQSSKGSITTKPKMGSYISSIDTGVLSTPICRMLHTSNLSSNLNTSLDTVDYPSKFDKWRTTEKNPHSQVFLKKKEYEKDLSRNLQGSVIQQNISELCARDPYEYRSDIKKPSRFLRSSIDKVEEEKNNIVESNPVSSCEDKMAKLKMLLRKPKPIDNYNIEQTCNIECKSLEPLPDNNLPFTSLTDYSLESINSDISDICEKFEALVINEDNENDVNLLPHSGDSHLNSIETSSDDIIVPDCIENLCKNSEPEILIVEPVDSINNNNSNEMIPSQIISEQEIVETTTPLTPESFDYEEQFERCLENKSRKKKHSKTKKRSKGKSGDKKKCDIENNLMKSAIHSGKHKEYKRDKKQNKNDIFTVECNAEPMPQTMPSPVYFCPTTSKLFYKTKPLHRKQNKRRSTICVTNKLIEYMAGVLKLPYKINAIDNTTTDFDEVNGRFLNSDTSDDDFTIVFSDNNCTEVRKSPQRNDEHESECESENSFVICFESDCEVDGVLTTETESSDSEDDESSDTLMEGQKPLKTCLKKPRTSPPSSRKRKTVTFDSAPPTVHQLIEWSYEYYLARIGNWEKYSRDAQRFEQRIMELSICLDRVLDREHRNRIFFQRFRPILMRQQREEREARLAAKNKQIEEDAANAESEQNITPNATSNNSESISAT